MRGNKRDTEVLKIMKSTSEKGHKKDTRICIPDSPLPRVVVVGGGFAGMALVKKLKNKPYQVVLIDRNNYHQFQPLLYQVAISGIEADGVLFPFRKLFKNNNNVVLRMAEVRSVDKENKTLSTSLGDIDYDYLVLAYGSQTNFYGMEGIKDASLSLKGITDALGIRAHLLNNLEKATAGCERRLREAYSSVAIVGGGSTGVEIAGALGEFKKFILSRDYPELEQNGMKILLLEAADRILLEMPEGLASKATDYLASLDVEVMLNAAVEDYDGQQVKLKDGRMLPAATFIWTAGVTGVELRGLPSGVFGKQGRIHVDEFFRVRELQDVFAIGDIALMKTDEYADGHPMVAQAAMQQGKHLAGNLIRMAEKKEVNPFVYRDKGALATVGRKRAVARIGERQISGYLAWLIWSVTHLVELVGARNRFRLLVNWLWDYFTYDKGYRSIIHLPGEKEKET